MSNQKKIAPPELPDEFVEYELPVEFYIPDGMLTVYSDTALVQHTPGEFILSFFQAEHPLNLSPEELKDVKRIKARCVSRIVMSHVQMTKFIKAVESNYQKYLAKLDSLKVEE